MQLNKLVLGSAGVARLTAEERTFFALACQFSNDLTILHKLVPCPAIDMDHNLMGLWGRRTDPCPDARR